MLITYMIEAKYNNISLGEYVRDKAVNNPDPTTKILCALAKRLVSSKKEHIKDVVGSHTNNQITSREIAYHSMSNPRAVTRALRRYGMVSYRKGIERYFNTEDLQEAVNIVRPLINEEDLY